MKIRKEVEDGELDDVKEVEAIEAGRVTQEAAANKETKDTPMSDQKPGFDEATTSSLATQTAHSLPAAPLKPANDRSSRQMNAPGKDSRARSTSQADSNTSSQDATDRGPPRRHDARNQPVRPPNLPNRPDHPDRMDTRNTRPQDTRLPPRPMDGSERRDARDARVSDHGRPGRYDERERDASFGHQAPADYRGFGRDRNIDRFDGPREARDFPMRSQEEQFARSREGRPTSRDTDRLERPSRGRLAHTDAPPARPEIDRPARDTQMAPPRTSVTQQSDATGQVATHPDRAALLNGGNQSGHGRADDTDRRNRSSRHTSPHRGDDSRGHTRGDRRDDRRSGNEGPPPSGPRGERARNGPNEHDHPADRFRDTAPVFTSTTKLDPNHGRLSQVEQGSDRSQDLFADQNDNHGPPSGPRGRNGPNRRGPASGPAGNERAPPSGPSNNRFGPPRHEQAPTPAPAASAPTAPETSNVHPDRLKALQSPTEPKFVQPATPQQMTNSQVDSSSVVPPSGPKVPTAPSGPRGAPTGPVADRNNAQRLLGGLTNQLQQASTPAAPRGNQGASIRGRAQGRQAHMGRNMSNPQNSLPPTPVAQAPDSAVNSPASSIQNRPDLFADRRASASAEKLEDSSRRSRSSTRAVDTASTENADSRTKSSRHSSSRHEERDREHDRESKRTGASEDASRASSRRDDRERDRSDRDRAPREHDRRDDRERDRDRSTRNEPAPAPSPMAPPSSMSANMTPIANSRRRGDRRDRDTNDSTPNQNASSVANTPDTSRGSSHRDRDRDHNRNDRDRRDRGGDDSGRDRGRDRSSRHSSHQQGQPPIPPPPPPMGGPPMYEGERPWASSGGVGINRDRGGRGHDGNDNGHGSRKRRGAPEEGGDLGGRNGGGGNRGMGSGDNKRPRRGPG